MTNVIEMKNGFYFYLSTLDLFESNIKVTFTHNIPSKNLQNINISKVWLNADITVKTKMPPKPKTMNFLRPNVSVRNPAATDDKSIPE